MEKETHNERRSERGSGGMGSCEGAGREKTVQKHAKASDGTGRHSSSGKERAGGSRRGATDKMSADNSMRRIPDKMPSAGRHSGSDKDRAGRSRHRASGEKPAGAGKRHALIRIKLIVAAVLALLILICIIKVVVYVGGISRVHLTDEGLTHNERYKNCVVVHGIDVSAYQDEINWKKVKSGEADFAFVRAAYRNSKDGSLNEDEDFKDNMRKAHKAGLMTGAYIFSQALNEDEAVEEADYLLKLVKSYDVDMPLVIDFETVKDGRLEEAISSGSMSYASAYHDIVLAFCRRIESAGYESAVYANYNMLTNFMDSTLLDDEAVIWAAHYGGECGVEGDYRFWQCAEDASISGIEGNVDHDIWYIEPGKVYETKAAGIADAVSVSDLDISVDEEDCKLSNHRATPDVTVTYKGKKLRKGRHYELSYIRNQVNGTGYAVVRGIGKYKDWTAVPFSIE
ncbi:MAG: glycoside hydrolase family 25 protein [Mogibacterium sp.]|nr:glycoside hydrolase family 25 protein [Mogibacterium sp.]